MRQKDPAMNFILEVQPEGDPAFQAQTNGVIAEASVSKYQPGREIFFKYDANDNTHAVSGPLPRRGEHGGVRSILSRSIYPHYAVSYTHLTLPTN